MDGVEGVDLVVVFAAYVLGTFPTAQLVTRGRGIDPSAAGSKNPGASNTFRLAGRRAGAMVLLGDLLKGAGGGLVGLVVGGRALGVVAAVAVVMGHTLPVTRRLRGGKGVASGAGATLALWPPIFVVAAATWGALAKLTGKASVASLAVIIELPVGVWVLGRPGWEVASAAGLSLFVALRHLDNIRRLVSGTERGLSDPSPSA